MNAKQKAAIEAIREVIQSETSPKRMSKEQYLEVLEEIAADIEGAIEATEQELANE